MNEQDTLRIINDIQDSGSLGVFITDNEESLSNKCIMSNLARFLKVADGQQISKEEAESLYKKSILAIYTLNAGVNRYKEDLSSMLNIPVSSINEDIISIAKTAEKTFLTESY